MGKVRVPISQALQIRWEKSPFYEKCMGNNFPALSIRWVLLSFSALWEIDGKTHAFRI